MTKEADSPKRDGAEHQNSCNYSVDLSKQFLTFAAGGIAFVVAAMLTPPGSATGLTYTSFGAFAGSMLFGLLYVMSVVGHISRDKNYDVYTPLLRAFSVLQILTFALGVTCLGILIVERAGGDSRSVSESFIDIRTKGQTVRQVMPPGAVVQVNVSAAGEVSVVVRTPTRK